MAKSFSAIPTNIPTPHTPLFDASNILRCYSTAALSQPFMPEFLPQPPFMQPCMPICMPQEQPTCVRQYDFADFQPDLCCIGRQLRKLRNKYRQQQCVIPIVN
jgi:hypothetical protein